MKSLWSSKTFLVAVLQAAAGLITAAMVADPTIATVGWVLTAKSVLDVILRLVTTQQVFIK